MHRVAARTAKAVVPVLVAQQVSHAAALQQRGRVMQAAFLTQAHKVIDQRLHLRVCRHATGLQRTRRMQQAPRLRMQQQLLLHARTPACACMIAKLRRLPATAAGARACTLASAGPMCTTSAVPASGSTRAAYMTPLRSSLKQPSSADGGSGGYTERCSSGAGRVDRGWPQPATHWRRTARHAASRRATARRAHLPSC